MLQRETSVKLRTWFAITTVILYTIHPMHRAYGLQAQSLSPSGSPLTISLSAKADHFKAGLPIPVEMTITNTGKAPVTLEVIAARHSEYYGYRFALALDGKNVPKTSFHKALIREDGATDPEVPYDASSNTFTMKPGQVEHIPIDVRQLFLVAQPGLYILSVEMQKNMDNKVPIHSQPLQLNVAP
jgi:hypothetical protein